VIYREQSDIVRALKSGRVIAVHHKPDPMKGGNIYEGTPKMFAGLEVSDGRVKFTIYGEVHDVPLTEIASVGTL